TTYVSTDMFDCGAPLRSDATISSGSWYGQRPGVSGGAGEDAHEGRRSRLGSPSVSRITMVLRQLLARQFGSLVGPNCSPTLSGSGKVSFQRNSRASSSKPAIGVAPYGRVDKSTFWIQ